MSLVHLLLLIFVTTISAQALDAISSTSRPSTTGLSFFTGTSSQLDGQPPAFITVTRSSKTSASIPAGSPTSDLGISPDSPGYSTGYTVGTAVGGAIGGILIISLLIFWFRAHKKKKQRLSIGIASASSNKLTENEKEKTKENEKNEAIPKRIPQDTSPGDTAVGTGTHVKKLDGVRVLKSTNTL
ncbi:hypothetical protein ACET3X_004151 [Alternaria dauci]|uniref:Mid2 domain-containing protein n=1 Tax=Alternaria dauci TaxID=48095 RepID=A0ABR3UMI5_9PLEO